MSDCVNCGYYWADLDDEGEPISLEYCHYVGPDAWAPCAVDEYEGEPEDYPDYEEWEDDVYWVHEFSQPYDYQEF